MKRRLPTITVVMLAFSLMALSACADRADPVALGELCLPETDQCSATVDLERPGVGRNAMDFTIYGQGDADDHSTPVVRVTTDDENLSLPDERPETAAGHTIVFEREYPMAGDETVTERLDGYDLTVARRLTLEFDCAEGDCHHLLDYLYLLDSIECIDDGVCGRQKDCEPAYGRCAECAEDSDCDSAQVCDRETGSCFPGNTTGCQNIDGAPFSPYSALFVVLISMLALAAIRSRTARRSLTSSSAVITALSAVLLVSTLVPSTAEARTGASMSAGGGMRVLTGEVGQLTHTGWGIAIMQQIRYRKVGLSFQLSTNSFRLTDEVSSRGDRLSGYGITVGPRAFIPLPVSLPIAFGDRPFEVALAADYTRWNVAENRLASVTGLDLSYHAAGPTAAISANWGGIELRLRANYSHIFGWPGGVFTLDLMAGLGQ